MNFKIILLALSTLFVLNKNPQVELNGESQYLPFKAGGVEYTIAEQPWDVNLLGNHRAILNLDRTYTSPILVEIPWRRPDLNPETKKIIIVDAESGKSIDEVSVIENNPEKGTIVFKPISGSKTYFIYYLPYKFRKGYDDARYGKPWNDYLVVEESSISEWDKKYKKNYKTYPRISVNKIESRTLFDFFTSMGIIATKSEQNEIKNKYPDKDFILFPEDRAFPIRSIKQLPYRWVENGSKQEFQGIVQRNEYYTWQIGLWASKKDLQNVRIQFSDLVSENGTIKKEEITCFNQEGINWDGKPINFRIDVPKDGIQALWNGVQIPEDAKPGIYAGTIQVSSENGGSQTISIKLDIKNQIINEHGDNELWRHSRLRWLNSRIGIDDQPVTPYQNMKVAGSKIEASGKVVSLSQNGLPKQIRINNKEVLAEPINLILELENKEIVFNSHNINIQKIADGLVKWTAHSIQDHISIVCEANMEYDGFINYKLKLSSSDNIKVKNIKLENSYSKTSSSYFMGAGFKGGFTPENYIWDWKGPYDSYWIGSDLSGLHFEFRGSTYNGPLLNDYKPEAPKSWSNDGKGKVVLKENSRNGKTVIAETGEKIINNDTLTLEYALLITPVKPVNSANHFSERYYHSKPTGFEKASLEGANIANIHHSESLNPVINYPFIVQDSLIQFINQEHAGNRKVKLYYTIRELSNYTTEIFALKSLNHEIFVSGVGFGTPWQMEHLIDDYKPAWYTELPGQQADAALVLSGFSRWINYYLEGLRWMFEHYKIDGIYMDDVSFDRFVMKRMRKISEKYRPGALVDLHSNTGYSIGPANQYTDFFPYVDRLWFGESFKYNEMSPDEWFVTFSGIPFGQMSEMLQDGGNRYLGMVYGSTARHSYGKFSPAPMWKLWKDFGIEQSKMIGYWDENSIVNTKNDSVKATVYLKPDSMLIAIGNFDKDVQIIDLDINWKKTGLNPKVMQIIAPKIENFQEFKALGNTQKIELKPKEGIILLIKPKGEHKK